MLAAFSRRRVTFPRAKAGQNDIISDAPNGLPRNDMIVSSADAPFPARRHYDRHKPSGTGIDFNIIDISESAAIADADDLLAPEVYNTAI